jgi:hypothetical protein
LAVIFRKKLVNAFDEDKLSDYISDGLNLLLDTRLTFLVNQIILKSRIILGKMLSH